MPARHEERVEEIVSDFLRPSAKVHLISIQRIYRHLTGEDVEFHEWDEAIDQLLNLDWDTDRLREFAELSKQIARGGETRRSETYFNLVEPDQITADVIEEEFSRQEFEPNTDGPEREGFKWDREGELIEGQYIYTDVDKELTFSGEVKVQETEDFLEFRIFPELSLLILESTAVVDVQKTRRYFGRKTNLEIGVCGPLTTYPDDAVDMVNGFLDSFEDGRQDADSTEPGLLQIDEIRLRYAGDDTEDESLENINFEGDDIGGHDDVSERLANGWIIKGFSAPIDYRNDQFMMTIAGTGMMAYAKVEGSSDQRKASDLLEIIRERYMENLRMFDH